MQNIGLNTEQPYKSGHSLWFQSSKLPLSWGFQNNLSKSTGRHTLGKQPVNSPGFEILTDPRTEKAAGLVHLDARWYNPQTTRFVQPDLWNFASTGLPKEIQHEVMRFVGLNVVLLLKDPSQQSVFGYARANPAISKDLSGLAVDEWSPLHTAGVIIGGTAGGPFGAALGLVDAVSDITTGHSVLGAATDWVTGREDWASGADLFMDFKNGKGALKSAEVIVSGKFGAATLVDGASSVLALTSAYNTLEEVLPYPEYINGNGVISQVNQGGMCLAPGPSMRANK